MGGRVRPEVAVWVDGYETADNGPDPGGQNWWGWFLPADWPPYVLDVGGNVLVFRADLDDGASIMTSIDVTCDPALRAVPGFITSMTHANGSGFEVVFEAGLIDDQPDGWAIIDTSPIDLEVDEDVSFIVYEGGRWQTRFIFTATEFAERTSDCTPTNPVPYELLVDSSDHVRQAMQLEPTLHFCLGE
jgi:hypothetical protein